jgi:hypothetical protein
MSAEDEGLASVGDKPGRIPNAPRGLGVAGRQLWRAIVREAEFFAHEEATLTSACKVADEIATLEEALRDSSTWIEGSKSQRKLNPVFAELRAHRLALARLLREAGVAGIDGDESDGLAKSSAGRRLAGMRWRPRGMQELFDRETA